MSDLRSIEGGKSTHVFQLGDERELADALVRELKRNGPLVAAEDTVFQYRKPCWLKLDRATLSRVVQGFSGADIGAGKSKKKVRVGDRTVKGTINLARDQLDCAGFFDAAPAGIAFRNGFAALTASGVALQPHDPDQRQRFAYDFDLDLDSAPVGFVRLLTECWAGVPDIDERVQFLREFGGASLLGIAPSFARCVVFHGDGGTGKSTVISVLRDSAPPDSYIASPPHRWHEPYFVASLAGKLLNLVSELPSSELMEAEAFKAVVSGDLVEGRRPRGEPFSFQPRAGHVFAANTLPATADQTHGFWRRFVVLTFPNKVEPSKQDAGLAARIVADELPALVGWMLRGACELQRRGSYVVPSSHGAELEHWRRESNPVAAFVDEWTTPTSEPDEFVGATELFKAFKRYATEFGFRQMSIKKFSQRMAQLGVASEHTRVGKLFPVRLAEPRSGL